MATLTVSGSGNKLIFPDNTFLTTATGLGTITGVSTATSSGLTGGGTSGTLSLAVDSTVARTNAANSFTGNQTVTGNLTISGTTGQKLIFPDGTAFTTAVAPHTSATCKTVYNGTASCSCSQRTVSNVQVAVQLDMVPSINVLLLEIQEHHVMRMVIHPQDIQIVQRAHVVFVHQTKNLFRIYKIAP